MAESSEYAIAKLATSLKCGSVVAAAGCGKTEQIALATWLADGRKLILTHTHAGIDVLRARLTKLKVPSNKFRLDTIAGWCLRYCASFPKRSGIKNVQPQTDSEWNAVYEAAARLVSSRAVNDILTSSYRGVFVDEYQDCSSFQHQTLRALSKALPICVFGDPMQAIFDFKGQRPVDWNTEVFPTFPKAAELVTPWRWNKAGNKALGDWLATIRKSLEVSGELNLNRRPNCVKWEKLPTDPRFRNAKIVEVCKRALSGMNGGTIVVIGDAANINSRAAIAKNLAKAGFSNIEPVSCASLYSAAAKIENTKDFARLEAAVEFICNCLTGVEETRFLDAVKSRQGGGKLGVARYGDLIVTGLAVIHDPTDQAILDLMNGFNAQEYTYCFRKEMFFAMRAALRIKCARQSCTLADAIWEVQNRIRHAGRLINTKSIGSTLLVKGLEFDHAVVVHADSMSRKDWYVALTRAVKSVTILSPFDRFKAV